MPHLERVLRGALAGYPEASVGLEGCPPIVISIPSGVYVAGDGPPPPGPNAAETQAAAEKVAKPYGRRVVLAVDE